MELDRWEQIERLYHAALERGPDAREAFLDEACAGDEDLRREVAGLLACDVPSDSFIQSPAIEIAARALAAEPLIEASTNPMGSLIAGSRIGVYQLLEPLGRGGMGEVHLALDTRLGRKVAVKLLLAEFTADDERLRRFEQEARAASALNHPNIITVHEIGEMEGRLFIITEYVEGETLRQKMSSAPQLRIRLTEALDIAAQVAVALQAAHDAGITHRDIKPENVMSRNDGLVKVLDFGLAKLSSERAGSLSLSAENMNTRSGMVMGTASYMSPEQARGENVDHRTDIFSLGVMLYEMLAGRRPFEGGTAIDVMAAVLTSEPVPLVELVPEVPASLWQIAQRCLEKRSGKRFQSAGDLGFALGSLSTSSGLLRESKLDKQSGAPVLIENVGASSVRKRERLAWLLAATLLLGMLGFAWAYFTRQPMANDLRAMRFSIPPPARSSFSQVAVSPDGRHLALTAATGGKLQLWVRAFDSTEARPLAGTQGARLPFWSPDSRFIGFFANGRLKKIELTGGPVQTLCEAPLPLGGAWSRDGVILFAPAPAAGLWRISATGGEITRVTTIDKSSQEFVHTYPTFVPDGRHFIYSIVSGQKRAHGVYLGSLDGTLKRRLLDQVTVIKYMPAVPVDASSGAGWLLFGQDDALLARPFDARRLDFTGEPISLSDKIGNDVLSQHYSIFSVSDNGVLVFDPSLRRQRRKYLLVDRRGNPINSLDVAAGHFQVSLSPDAKRFIADRFDPDSQTLDLWMYDVSGANAQRFTNHPADDFNPIWSPDGSRIVWISDQSESANLYQKAANLAGEETLLLKSDYHKIPTDWSQNGRFIVYQQEDPKTKLDIWVLPTPGSGGAAFPVVRTEANEITGTLSPDGRWLAYASDVSGRYEVWVQGFPEGGGKRQVSNGGGIGPRWRRNGRELFYYSGDGKLMVAQVRSGESLEVGAATSLFEFLAGTLLTNFTPYDVTADGERFLINAVVETEPNAPLTVVVNWAADLKK